MTKSQYIATLSPTTSELIRRYGEFDTEGYLKSFYIINEELIGAIRNAGQWLKEGLWANECLSEEWEKENPCNACPERPKCGITCRRKHAFDKEVYGGFLCGHKPVAYRLACASKEVENEVRFRVRLEGENELVFSRDIDYAPEAIVFGRGGVVTIECKQIILPPWSAALYKMFTLHPQGFPLSDLAGELKTEFISTYKTTSGSEIKTKKMKEQLRSPRLSHILNNKLSALNSQLRSNGISEDFIPRTEKYKSNNKPYFIPYLSE